jgi:hypothetical protein
VKIRNFVAAVLVAAPSIGCSRRLADPPPPAASSELPTAPPGAIGARAASLHPSPPTRTLPAFPETEDEEDEADAGFETPGDDAAGVEL